MSFLDKPDVQSISETTALLHLFAHRNKNQHRRSIWWRHFSIFRRQLNGLEQDLKQLTVTPSTHVERAKLKAASPQLRAHINERLQSWPIAKWQHAFSQLLADGRFAQLALVLLAALSQICKLTNITLRLEGMAEYEIQQALRAFGRDHWQDKEKAVLESSEDVGAAVSRDTAADIETKHTSATKPRIRRPKTKSSRKREKDAIDELFGDV